MKTLLYSLLGLGFVASAVGVACSGEAPAAPTPPAPVVPATPVAAPLREPLEGGPFPALLIAQAQFVRDANNKPKPGPALMTIWRKTDAGWKSTRLEDPDSNVFHKAKVADGGIYTIGAEQAFLKKWTFSGGSWSAESIWNPKWEGKFNRVRDLEIGDVTGDGADDYVMATHDAGVIAVGEKRDGKIVVTELTKQADRFVHEIEIGDVDGDGKNEFFATPSDRNQSSGASQPGQVVMFKWDGAKFQQSVVDDFTASHAKEILAVDMEGKGRSSFFSVVEAETKVEGKEVTIVKPVEIREYTFGKDGKVTHTVAATIDDRQCRFLVPGDFDGDGRKELIAAAMKTGIWMLKKGADGKWTSTNIERDSGGFEHAAVAGDLDKNGTLELYVASDTHHELRVHTYNPATRLFEKTIIGMVPKDSLTWNIVPGEI